MMLRFNLKRQSFTAENAEKIQVYKVLLVLNFSSQIMGNQWV